MTALRSLVFLLVATVWTLPPAVAFSPLLLLPKKGVRLLSQVWIKGLLLFSRLICGIKSEVRGEEYIAATPAIYAAKHQSAWDIMIIVATLPRPVFVLKRELTWIPFFGWYLMKLGMVAIDRKQGARALKRMAKKARVHMREGSSLVIFPEGTRVAPGKTGKYQAGVGLLYNELKLPVVPVAIASGHCWGKNAFLKRPGRAIAKFLPPIAPGLPPRELIRQLQDAIEPESAKLLAEAAQA